MMHPGKPVPAQKIYVVSQFLRIPPPLGKGNDAAAGQALPVHGLSQFLPHRVLAPALCRCGSKNLYPDLFFHGRCADDRWFRGQVRGCQFQGFYGGRQADTLKRPLTEAVQPCNGQHEMGSPLCVNQCVKFINDYRPCCP